VVEGLYNGGRTGLSRESRCIGWDMGVAGSVRAFRVRNEQEIACFWRVWTRFWVVFVNFYTKDCVASHCYNWVFCENRNKNKFLRR